MLLQDHKIVGKRIRDIRKRQNKTQAEIAEKANISCRAYADIERGSTDMRVSSLLQICTALRITPDEVLTDKIHEIDIDPQELLRKLDKCDADMRASALRLIEAFLETV